LISSSLEKYSFLKTLLNKDHESSNSLSNIGKQWPLRKRIHRIRNDFILNVPKDYNLLIIRIITNPIFIYKQFLFAYVDVRRDKSNDITLFNHDKHLFIYLMLDKKKPIVISMNSKQILQTVLIYKQNYSIIQ
jgi:hypothetical protein